MDSEYKEIKMGRFYFYKGLILGSLSVLLLIPCCIVSLKECLIMVLFLIIMLAYGVHSCLEQINWYLRYNADGFEIRNSIGKIGRHHYGDIKSIRTLRRDALIIYIKDSRRQYEIEPGIAGIDNFYNTYKAYISGGKESKE